MSLLDKLFGKGKEQAGTMTVECPHTALVAKWDELADMGKQDRVSGYTCTACNRSFTPQEAEPFVR